ncbi:hypothetical protein AXG93_1747s1000 [Marchantia polymorpha subsp. ruderalis]|uniref:Uncharacterized protein n=1 Tax=Marchantia polymorpha subsp. ruderalis TaxID=1480154 RepID=A0A176VC20_MARPO|nr:hypothetical protein AXG93_1747s1000 [Marchantia polymorpha subsp. ruderalis]
MGLYLYPTFYLTRSAMVYLYLLPQGNYPVTSLPYLAESYVQYSRTNGISIVISGLTRIYNAAAPPLSSLLGHPIIPVDLSKIGFVHAARCIILSDHVDSSCALVPRSLPNAASLISCSWWALPVPEVLGCGIARKPRSRKPQALDDQEFPNAAVVPADESRINHELAPAILARNRSVVPASHPNGSALPGVRKLLVGTLSCALQDLSLTQGPVKQ